MGGRWGGKASSVEGRGDGVAESETGAQVGTSKGAEVRLLEGGRRGWVEKENGTWQGGERESSRTVKVKQQRAKQGSLYYTKGFGWVGVAEIEIPDGRPGYPFQANKILNNREIWVWRDASGQCLCQSVTEWLTPPPALGVLVLTF